MHGCQRDFARWIVPLLILCAAGCEADLPGADAGGKPSSDLATQFDPARTGIVQGCLTWIGEAPEVSWLYSSPAPLQPPPREPVRAWNNPFTPRVAASGGVEDAVVFLSGVEKARSRPWHHSPARVELRDHQLLVYQGEACSRHGFVRRGTRFEIGSTDAVRYVLRGRGAAFFAHALVEPDQPRERLLRESGIVELGEGAGRFWMRGFLFVDDHPYYTRTDQQGNFRLEQVPDGEYDLSFFLPDWHIKVIERDRNWTQAANVTFARPLVLVRKVQVQRGRITTASAEVSERSFER